MKKLFFLFVCGLLFFSCDYKNIEKTSIPSELEKIYFSDTYYRTILMKADSNSSSYSYSSSNPFEYVYEFYGDPLGDSSYELYNYKVHVFSLSDSAYKNKTGTELIELLKSESVTPASSETYSKSKAGSFSIDDYENDSYLYFYFDKGIPFTIYSY